MPSTPKLPAAELARRARRRQDKIDALRRTADDRLARLLTDRETWVQVLELAARFPQLGLLNCLLLAEQRPDATGIAGYDAWQACGRQVTKGERGIRLLHAGPDGAVSLVHLWDLAQTTGDDPAAVEHPSRLAVREALERLAAEHGYDIHTTDIPEPIFDPDHRQITLPVGLPHHGTAELAGQISHILRGHVDAAAAAVISHVHALRAGQTRPAPDPPADPDALLEIWRHLAVLHHHTENPRVTPELADRVQAGTRRAAEMARTAERQTPPTVEVSDKDVLVAAHQDAQAFFRSRLGPSWVTGYLRRRGLDAMLTPASKWKVGYAPDTWTALTDHLRTLGYSDHTIESSGLATRSRRGTLIDRFRHRMMLPVLDPADGAIIAFVGRAHPEAGGEVPKYLNSPETSIYRKGDILCGLVEGRDSLAVGARPVVVEGFLDAAAVSIAGGDRFVGVTPSGTALTARQIAALDHATAGLAKMGVLVAFDADAAGNHAAGRAFDLLSPVVPSERTLVVQLEDGSDPADLLRTEGPAALADRLLKSDKPLVDAVIDVRLRQHPPDLVEGRVAAVRDVMTLIAGLTPAEMTRQIRTLAEKLDMDTGTIAGEIAEMISPRTGSRAADFMVADVSVREFRSAAARQHYTFRRARSR